MTLVRRAPRWLAVLLVAFATLGSAVAFAGPRSGSSFGSRQGFRSGGGMSTPSPGYSGGYGSPYSGGYGNPYSGGYGWGRPHFFYPGFGYGYGGMGLFGSVAAVLVVGLVVASVVRAVRASRGAGSSWSSMGDAYGDEQVASMPDRAYLYKLQLAYGRSARGIQDRLAEFATQGDTESEAGLAALLQQTALELLREKDAVRYVGSDARGPLTFTNAETAMNAMAMTERSRFEVERVRAAGGRVVRSSAAAEEGKEALELVVVTLLVATRTPLGSFGDSRFESGSNNLTSRLSELGGLSQGTILGVEVIWTPADPNDSMTETDVMTTYPDLRSV
jgi:uncharacterized membrane protein